MRFFPRIGAAEPDEQRQAGRVALANRVLLCVLSGAMLGASFPPSSLGILACFGLVPLLIVLDRADTMGAALRSAYVAMLVFHIITLNWTGNYVEARDVYMMIAGAATMIIHPLFYFIPVSIYYAVKRHLGNNPALLALPFVWVAYEYTHSLSQLSFPWLTLGNSQSYDLPRIQVVSITGVYGLSFWILWTNVIGFVIYRILRRPVARLRAPLAGWIALLLLVYEIPNVYGSWVLAQAGSETPDTGRAINVGMVQANIDPWEKWQSGPETIALYEDLSRELVAHAKEKPDLILWPETALPYDVLYPGNRRLLDGLRKVVAQLRTPILTGMPHFVLYPDSVQAPPGARRMRETGQRYDSFNAAALFQPGTDSVTWYGKMKMVPLAERIPYAEIFSSFDFLRWGVGIGGWQIGPDSTIFVERTTGARFCTMICYESVYPGFVAAFVGKGAQFIALITIDSWWDKMSGAYQHQRFAVFRAVENRRWLARCALGGISCYIDPYGRVYDRTELFTRRTLDRTIWLSDHLTFYTRHIDLFAKSCLLIAALFLSAALGRIFVAHYRKQS